MRFVSVFVAAFLSYRRAISMNPSSPDEVLAYLRAEANNGNGRAFHDLGQIYAAPQLAQQFGIEVDQRQAVEYWRRGADLGDALCQSNFGSRLVRGYGVEMDEAAGFRYYKLAADQGSLEGLFGVAVCYENGEGVAVDLDEAWRLMNSALALAQANGDPGDYTSDIHAGLARIKSKRGGGNVAMVMTGPDGTVRTF